MSEVGLHRVHALVVPAAAATVVLGVLAIAVPIALHHPLSPYWALLLLAGWTAVAARFPAAWLVLVPAALPVMNLSPYTGWIGFEEFDLLVMGAITGGYARIAWHGARARRAGTNCVASLPVSRPARSVACLSALLAALTLVAGLRGLRHAEGQGFGWFQGYVDPLNIWRIGKPMLYAFALAPLLGAQMCASRSTALQRFAFGMLTGSVAAITAVLWERVTYPGLLDFTRPYRTVALFWEMHVGGAAIDAYFALAIPFVCWALWAARTPPRWGAAAILALLAGYACLTTFSRGLYIAVAVSFALLAGVLVARARPPSRAELHERIWADAMLCAALIALLTTVYWLHGSVAAFGVVLVSGALAAALWHARPRGWRPVAGAALALGLSLEVLVAFGPGSFMLTRTERNQIDSNSRLTHWSNGLHLLASWDDWLLGIGLGRLPSHYDRFAPGGEMPGAVHEVDEAAGGPAAAVFGPRSRPQLGGVYGLTQRVAQRARYRVAFDVRIDGIVDVYARVCEIHLLYEHRCQSVVKRVGNGADGWQHVELTLQGPALFQREGSANRAAVFKLSVLNPHTRADFTHVQLSGDDGAALLGNGDFSRGLAGWLPSAEHYFVPWHIDSLFLEVLIERGLVTLATMGALLFIALRGLFGDAGRDETLAPFIGTALCALLCVGVVSSVLDVPRVALLAVLMVIIGLHMPSAGAGDSTIAGRSRPVRDT